MSTLQIPQNRNTTISIQIENGDEPYHLENGDKVVFGVKKHYNNNYYLIYAETTEEQGDTGVYTINLTAEETNIPNLYAFYDVAIIQQYGTILTVIPCTECVICPSIVKGEEE